MLLMQKSLKTLAQIDFEFACIADMTDYKLYQNLSQSNSHYSDSCDIYST